MIIFFIGLVYVINKHCKKEIKGRRINFPKAIITTYLVIMGKILDVLFRLLTCTNIGDDAVHFYFGYQDCYGQTWIWSIIVLLVMIGFFIAIFMKLVEVDQNTKQDPNYFLNIITSRYKPQYYYWELILFTRRIIIALVSVSEPNIVIKFIFIGLMIFFSYLQYLYNPFIIHQANQMEFMLINAYIFAVMIQMPLNPKFSNKQLNIATSVLILFPIILIIYYTAQLVIMKYKDSEKIVRHKEIELSLPLLGNMYQPPTSKTHSKASNDADEIGVELKGIHREITPEDSYMDPSDDNDNIYADSDGNEQDNDESDNNII